MNKFDLSLPSISFAVKVLVVLAVVVLAAQYIPGASGIKKYFGLA